MCVCVCVFVWRTLTVVGHVLLFSSGRFLFVLLGPHGKAKAYNEIGRAIATLMVDDVSKPKDFLPPPHTHQLHSG